MAFRWSTFSSSLFTAFHWLQIVAFFAVLPSLSAKSFCDRHDSVLENLFGLTDNLTSTDNTTITSVVTKADFIVVAEPGGRCQGTFHYIAVLKDHLEKQLTGKCGNRAFRVDNFERGGKQHWIFILRSKSSGHYELFYDSLQPVPVSDEFNTNTFKRCIQYYLLPNKGKTV